MYVCMYVCMYVLKIITLYVRLYVLCVIDSPRSIRACSRRSQNGAHISTRDGCGVSSHFINMCRGVVLSRVSDLRRGQMDLTTFKLKSTLPQKLYRFNPMFSVTLRVKG
jgi:hypothetical protein